MNITVYINSKRLDENIRQATDEYIKRLSAFCRLKIICQANAPVFDDSHNTCHFIITTAKSGKSKNNFAPDTITSVDFAKKINQLAVSGLSNIVYYIGYRRSDIEKPFSKTFAISTMSLSYPVLLTALIEQIYRAYTINNNITYHK